MTNHTPDPMGEVSEPKHTPGPWCFYASPVGLPGLTWSIYADVNTGTDGPDAAQHLAEVFGQDAFTNNANAALIARAPDLLAENQRLREALRGLVRLHGEQVFINGEDDNETVRDALLQAESALSAVERGAKV